MGRKESVAAGDALAIGVEPQDPLPDDGDDEHSTRHRLLTATYDLLVERGYQATTLQNVVRRAGLSTGAIYANFANKQDLMAAAVLHRLSTLGMGLPPVAPETARGEVLRLMSLLARHLAAAPRPEHRLLTEVTGAVIREESIESPLRTSVQLLAVIVRDVLERAQREGVIDESFSTDALVGVVLSVYLGAITTKAWGLPQPELGDVLEVLRAMSTGFTGRPSCDRA